MSTPTRSTRCWYCVGTANFARLESRPCGNAIPIGSPTVRVKVTSSSGEAVLFGKVYDVGPDGRGKAIANLATEELSHPAPVFHGDTLFVESEVLEKRESQSKPDRGTVKVHTRVHNQDGVLVAEFKRVVLVPKRHPGPTDPAEGNVE